MTNLRRGKIIYYIIFRSIIPPLFTLSGREALFI